MGVRQTSTLGLGNLIGKLTTVQSRGFRREVAANLAEEARTQISNGFQKQRDPYGNPWAPITHRDGMILQDTGRMAASVSTKVVAGGFRVDIPVVYAAVHQYGLKAHKRKARAQPLGRNGRPISKRKAAASKAASRRVSFVGSFRHGGIPRRQMVPMDSTGGLGSIWTAAFHRVVTELVKGNLE